jgi:hypothetical protein
MSCDVIRSEGAEIDPGLEPGSYRHTCDRDVRVLSCRVASTDGWTCTRLLSWISIRYKLDVTRWIHTYTRRHCRTKNVNEVATLCCKVLLQKPIVAQQSKKFSVFYRTWRFVCVFGKDNATSTSELTYRQVKFTINFNKTIILLSTDRFPKWSLLSGLRFIFSMSHSYMLHVLLILIL